MIYIDKAELHVSGNSLKYNMHALGTNRLNQSRHEKNKIRQMRKQRRRSASKQLRT